MKTQIKSLLVALAITCVLASAGFAQQMTGPQTRIDAPVQTQTQQYVLPGVQPIQPVPQNSFYFGMRVVLKRNGWGQTTLQVVEVTPGSPAQQAGLEYGDEIRRVNGRGFKFANDSFDAVRMINQFVLTPVFGGPAPAGGAGGVTALVIGPMPSPNPVARMVVRNVRNGQDVIVNVYPARVGGGGAPAVAAAVMSAGG